MVLIPAGIDDRAGRECAGPPGEQSLQVLPPGKLEQEVRKFSLILFHASPHAGLSLGSSTSSSTVLCFVGHLLNYRTYECDARLGFHSRRYDAQRAKLGVTQPKCAQDSPWPKPTRGSTVLSLLSGRKKTGRVCCSQLHRARRASQTAGRKLHTKANILGNSSCAAPRPERQPTAFSTTLSVGHASSKTFDPEEGTLFPFAPRSVAFPWVVWPLHPPGLLAGYPGVIATATTGGDGQLGSGGISRRHGCLQLR